MDEKGIKKVDLLLQGTEKSNLFPEEFTTAVLTPHSATPGYNTEKVPLLR